MSYTVLLTAGARTDEEEAYNYYEDIQPGLGVEFLKIIEQHYSSLSDNPFLYGYTDKRKTLRNLTVLRFPYVIIFEVRESNVIVFAVHNTHRQLRF